MTTHSANGSHTHAHTHAQFQSKFAINFPPNAQFPKHSCYAVAFECSVALARVVSIRQGENRDKNTTSPADYWYSTNRSTKRAIIVSPAREKLINPA